MLYEVIRVSNMVAYNQTVYVAADNAADAIEQAYNCFKTVTPAFLNKYMRYVANKID